MPSDVEAKYSLLFQRFWVPDVGWEHTGGFGRLIPYKNNCIHMLQGCSRMWTQSSSMSADNQQRSFKIHTPDQIKIIILMHIQCWLTDFLIIPLISIKMWFYTLSSSSMYSVLFNQFYNTDFLPHELNSKISPQKKPQPHVIYIIHYLWQRLWIQLVSLNSKRSTKLRKRLYCHWHSTHETAINQYKSSCKKNNSEI